MHDLKFKLVEFGADESVQIFFLMFHFLLRRGDHVPDSSRKKMAVAIDTLAVKPVVGSHVVSDRIHVLQDF